MAATVSLEWGRAPGAVTIPSQDYLGGGVSIVANTTAWETIDIAEFIPRKEVLDLYNPLAERVFEQEMRIRELEKIIDEIRSK